EKASPINGSFKSLGSFLSVIGGFTMIGSVGMLASNGLDRRVEENNLHNLTQKLIADTEKLAKEDERQAKYLRQGLTSVHEDIRMTENTLMRIKLASVALPFVTLLSGISLLVLFRSDFLINRGKLYLSNAQESDDIQIKFQKNVLTLATKRQEILEKSPELKGFLSELYGNNLPSTVEAHAKQLEEAIALQLYLELVPNDQDCVIEARDYYLRLNEKTFKTQDSTAYFPEIGLLKKLVSQQLKSDPISIQKSFRSVLDPILANQTTFEDGAHQLEQALKDIEPSLLFLQSQWVESILKELSQKETVEYQKNEIISIESSIQEKSALIQELNTQCENFNKKIGNPQAERSLKGLNNIEDDGLPPSESDMEHFHQAKKALVHTQLEAAKRQVEKFSLEQKYQDACLKWTAAQQSTYNAHQAFKALSLEKSEMTQLHQQLRQLVEMQQQFPETTRRDASLDVSPLQQLLEKEQRNPVLDSMERTFQQASVKDAGK
ncbi:MAG: hypothetical protein K2X66_10305, partial [Cyanobacteria bacterium]|nr:hypothetical protein [Cyanobacteriota bacterium]